VNGVFGQTSDASGSGVLGAHNSTGAGVTGINLGGTGVSGQSGTGSGVSGSSVTGVAVEGVCKDAKGFAGKFTGNVSIAGDITTVNTITVTKDVVLTGADCAEQFDIISDARSPEPGTILVIDEEGKLRESREPYDPGVWLALCPAQESTVPPLCWIAAHPWKAVCPSRRWARSTVKWMPTPRP
jgi:hypothetical protein